MFDPPVWQNGKDMQDKRHMSLLHSRRRITSIHDSPSFIYQAEQDVRLAGMAEGKGHER
jgi:hypothetical protein